MLVVRSRNIHKYLGLIVSLGIFWGCSGVASGLENVPDVPIPESWDKYTILVWQFKTNVETDKALYESVNIRGFHIDRSNAVKQAFANETKWPFYVDHTASKGYLHLADKVRSTMSAEQKKTKGLMVRPNSLADPKVVAEAKGHIKKNIEAARGSSVLAYAFDDEVSIGNFGSPIEADAHPLALAKYRAFLKELYGNDIEKLNAQYGKRHSSFDEVQPLPYEGVRKGLQPGAIDKINLSVWCDWRSAMDTHFAEAMADFTRYANTLDPKTPAGVVGLGNPCAYGGYDYSKNCKALQWMEAYDIGASNEILRSFWGQKRPHMQTFFSSKDPKKDAWMLWYYMVHGNRGVICWPDGWFVNGQVADYIKANAETFKEVQSELSKPIVNGTFVHDPVAIYYSHPSIQVAWALDAAPHGGTWVNRSSSMDNGHSTSGLTRIAWVKTLEDLGIQGHFVHHEQLKAGELEKAGFKVLLLNRTLCLSDAEAEAIKKFAAAGGTVIGDQLCGYFDEHGKARAKGALDDLFGIQRNLSKGILNGQTLTEVDCEKGYKGLEDANWVRGPLFKEMAVYEPGLTATDGEVVAKAGEVPVVIKKGKAIYLNLSPIGYLLKRTGNQAPDWLPFVEGLFKDAGVTARLKFEVNDKPGQMVEPIFWKNGDRITLCVVQNVNRKAAIDGFGSSDSDLGGGKSKLGLLFAKPVKGLKNERTGKELGDGAKFTDEWAPWEANVYSYTP